MVVITMKIAMAVILEESVPLYSRRASPVLDTGTTKDLREEIEEVITL
ncbi:MAG: hypothetical protein Q8O43_02425 [Dehalococcoidia bacterium]|nr:hypothetical protein [Dehalococcoidia bacterium]